jgi:hypothetical protein
MTNGGAKLFPTICGNIGNSVILVAFTTATGEKVGDENDARGVDNKSGWAVAVDMGVGVEESVGVDSDVVAQAAEQTNTIARTIPTRIFILGHAFVVIGS